MAYLFPGLAILIAVSISSVGPAYAADADSAATNTSLPRPAPCDPNARICGQWNYAGSPSHVFTGGIGQAARVFRLGADRETAYIGVNTRWNLPVAGNVDRYGGTGNFLLACKAGTGKCEALKASDSKVVMHVLGVDGPNLVAEVETYLTDDLNRHDVSYVKSSDFGQTWSPVPVPENCNSRRSCRIASVQGGDYVLLATDTSAESFGEWTTKVYRSSDGGQTWLQQTKGRGVLSMQWSAFASRDGVDMVLGPRNRETAIVNVAAGREDVVLSDMSSLHGSVIKLTGNGDVLYALVDSGVFPAKEFRLYVVENHAATELWRAPTIVGDVWATDKTIVLQTEDRREMVLPAGVFRTVLQVSTDRGKTWQSDRLPDELAENVVEVVGNRIWVVTPRAVWYRDIL